MDVIVIGKKSIAHSAPPHVVYCGTCREEARQAAAKTNGVFPFLYFIDPAPYQRIPAPEAVAESTPEEAPEPPSKSKKPK